MTTSYKRGWMRPVSLTLLSLAALTAACGGSDDPVAGGTPPLSDADAAFCNGTDYQRVLHPVAGAAVGEGGEAVVQDIRTLRVHYRRTDGGYAGWGLHLWDTNGIDTSRLPFPASTLAQWGAPVPLSSMPGYTETEKIQIGRRFLIPKQMTNHGLKDKHIQITDEAMVEIVQAYTKEAGVRNLEREIGKVLRKAATLVAKAEPTLRPAVAVQAPTPPLPARS